MRQLQKDRFPTPESGAWPTTKRVLKVLGAIAGGVSYSYVSGILFANDPGVRTLLFSLGPDNDGYVEGWIYIGCLGGALFLPETMHAYKAIGEVSHLIQEEPGLKKTNQRVWRWLSELGIATLSAGMTYKIFRIWLDIGQAGPVEFWTNAPLFAPLTFLHTWVPARNLLHKTWNYFSRGATVGVRTHRALLRDRFAAANRALLAAPDADLMELATLIRSLNQQLQDQDALNSHGHLLLLPLLYGLYHLGEAYDEHSPPLKKHPLGYRLTQWAGRLLPALGSAGYWLAAKYVMSKSLDLVTEDYTYAPSSNAQDALIYTYTVGMTGYVLATTGKLLGDQLGNVYSWFTNYNPNTVDTTIARRPLNMRKLRGSTAIFSQLFSMFVQFPAGMLAAIGNMVQNGREMSAIYTIFVPSLIGYGAAGNESFGASLQDVISALTHTRGRGVRGKIRHALTGFLAAASNHIAELPDKAVEGLYTLLTTPSADLSTQIYNRLRETTLTYCPDRVPEFETLWGRYQPSIHDLMDHGDVEMGEVGTPAPQGQRATESSTTLDADQQGSGILRRIVDVTVGGAKTLSSNALQVTRTTLKDLWDSIRKLEFFGW